MPDNFSSLLCYLKLPFLKVGEQITTSEIFHYYVDVVLIFKDI